MRSIRSKELAGAKRDFAADHRRENPQVRSIRLALALPAAFGIAGLLLSGSAFAQQAAANWTGPKLRVAVMDLSGSALKMQTQYQPSTTTTTVSLPPPADFARGLTEMLTTALHATGKFVVLERMALPQVLGEQDLGNSGRVNPETAAAAGKVIGAQALVTGDITEFAYQQTSVGGKLSVLQRLGAKGDRVTAKVALDIRMLDAVTGEVLFSQRSQGSASMTGVGADLTLGGNEFSGGGYANTPLGKASREAIEGAVAAIVTGMKKLPWSGRIIDLREGMVYINAGAELGIQPGMQFDVYEQQGALVDPETGKSLGTPDRKLGTIRVTKVQDKYSVAEVTDGTGFKRSNLVRFKGQAEKP